MAPRPVADWRHPEPYAALRRCDRHGFAWEWLRRSPAYQSAGTSAPSAPYDAAASFGLHRFEPFEVGVPKARPLWRAEADPFVLTVETAPVREGDDRFDIADFSAMADGFRDEDGVEHWLLSDGWHGVRLDVAGTLAMGPVALEYRLTGLAAARPAIATLSRLIAIARTGRLASGKFPIERRAPRWALTLRVYDAIQAGASQREIAATLFGIERAPQWKADNLSAWSRVRRLQDAARRAAAVKPARWLDGSFT
ncbi:MAG: DUF2285 domain-containing protein [Qipengyuania sp.]|nr:DUF2285 domain-containing protein [Qipengyuania sp.]